MPEPEPRKRPDAVTTPARPGGSLIDPPTLMRIKSLQMRAKVVVEGFFKGIHRSPYHGFSVEFSEYREYSPGDDPRYLDWRLYARSDRYYVKRFEDETNLRCYLVLDTSRSMGYRSGAYSKGEYARTAAATVAYFLSSQRDAVGLVSLPLARYALRRHFRQYMLCPVARPQGGLAGTSSRSRSQEAPRFHVFDNGISSERARRVVVGPLMKCRGCGRVSRLASSSTAPRLGTRCALRRQLRVEEVLVRRPQV